MAEDYDLSGEWTGIYNYPVLFPPNRFDAVLRESGGVLTGIIEEPPEGRGPGGGRRQAVIDGSRSGAAVSFVKLYDDLGSPSPHYSGTVQPGGDEIVGEWTIPGHWSGTFLMIRAGKAEAAVEREVGETVEI